MTEVKTPAAVLRAILNDPYVQRLGSWRLRGERALANSDDPSRPGTNMVKGN